MTLVIDDGVIGCVLFFWNRISVLSTSITTTCCALAEMASAPRGALKPVATSASASTKASCADHSLGSQVKHRRRAKAE